MTTHEIAQVPPVSQPAVRAPLASSFPAQPAGWIYFCHRRDLTRGSVSKRILDRDLVAFQAASGRVAVLGARCSHLGANLGCGEVVGETLQCPFHNWRFGPDGRCQWIPGSAEIPAFARQTSFPVAEIHGHVFFFNGSEPLFPLPFFADESPKDFDSAGVFSYTAEASWYMVAAQGFDRQHFETVHDRRLLRPPEVDCPFPFARRNRYHAEIIGQATRDRFLRLLAGKTVSLTIHNWAGVLFTVKAEFPRACNRFIVSYRPIENGRTHFDVIVFARRGLASLILGLRRRLTRAHLLAEADQIRGTEYRPARFVEADSDMVRFFCWLAALPQKPAREQGVDAAELATARAIS